MGRNDQAGAGARGDRAARGGPASRRVLAARPRRRSHRDGTRRRDAGVPPDVGSRPHQGDVERRLLRRGLGLQGRLPGPPRRRQALHRARREDRRRLGAPASARSRRGRARTRAGGGATHPQGPRRRRADLDDRLLTVHHRDEARRRRRAAEYRDGSRRAPRGARGDHRDDGALHGGRPRGRRRRAVLRDAGCERRGGDPGRERRLGAAVRAPRPRPREGRLGAHAPAPARQGHLLGRVDGAAGPRRELARSPDRADARRRVAAVQRRACRRSPHLAAAVDAVRAAAS